LRGFIWNARGGHETGLADFGKFAGCGPLIADTVGGGG